MNMKRFGKPLLLVLLGVVICIVAMLGITVYFGMRTNALSLRPPDPLNPQSAADYEMSERARELFAKGDVAGLNALMGIAEGEIELRINGPSTVPASHTPVAEVVIKNQSEHDLVVFEPRFMRLTPQSYNYQGYLQDDFSMECPLTLTSRCRVLKSTQTFSVPVLFNVKEIGKHKINLSVGFPVYKAIGWNTDSYSTTMIARESYICEIVEDRNAQPPAGSDSTNRSDAVRGSPQQ